MTDLERLRFACDLAGLKVDDLEKSERLAWEQRLGEFFEGRSETGVVGAPFEWKGVRRRAEARLDYPTDFRNLQVSARETLLAALGGNAKQVKVEYVQAVQPGVLVTVRSTVMSTFVAVLTAALLREGTARLARCERCGEVYVRLRSDARFCKQPACESQRQAVYFAAYVKTPKGRRARKRQIDEQRRRRKTKEKT